VSTPVLLISSGVTMVDVSQDIGHVMVTTTVEISVMKPKQTAARKVSYFFFFPHFNTYKPRQYFIVNTEEPSSVSGKKRKCY